MSVTPYVPTPFAAPVLNPAIGGAGAPYPYVSNSQYIFAPTAMDTGNLVPGGSPTEQTQSLADTLRRAAAWADRICFGMDAAAKGASLCATTSVESGHVPVTGRGLCLVCDYKPIIQVNGIDVGPDMSSLTPIANPQSVRIGRRTIYVPLGYAISGTRHLPQLVDSPGARAVAVWSYVNGYPHTRLAAPATAGATSITVDPTDGADGLLGIVGGVSTLRIADGASSESVAVSSVSGTTLDLVAPLAFAHTPPPSPDFIPVTAVPDDVEEAVILLTTALIKTRGDNSLELADITEPRGVEKTSGDELEDVTLAEAMLGPYRVRIKGHQ